MNYRIFTAFLILFIAFACKQEQVNLITNPGFETGEGEDPEGWTITISNFIKSYRLTTDETEFHSGTKSYKISRIWSYPRKPSSLKTDVPLQIDPEKDYLLSFWYKTADVTEYPLAFSVQFLVECDSASPVTYEKKIYNSDTWKQYHVLLDNIPHNAINLDLSFKCNISTRGAMWLDDIEFREAGEKDVAGFEQWRRQSIPQAKGNAASKKFKATGFYRVEKADDRWWLIDPEGEPTWAMATDGRGPALAPGSTETLVKYFKKEFGATPEAVNERMYRILIDECGFNSFSGWTADNFARISEKRYNAGEPYLPMSKVLGLSLACEDTAVLARDREGHLLNKGNHWVVDPFNPKWRKMAREKAEETIAPYKDKPWFLGWYVDNEIDYAELFRYVWAEYSSGEFIKLIEKKYKSIDTLNRVWTSPHKKYRYTSFDDILTDKPEPKEWNDPLWVDFTVFERFMIREYIDFTYNLVKELDPNHLVISNRLNLGPMPDIYRTIDLWGKYDIVCMNIYPDNNKIGFNPGELEIMKRLYEGTGRPVIIGEWSVPAIDSKLYEFGEDSLNRPLDWSWPQVLRTQKERGEAYEICIKQLASLDFVIGAGWYKTLDVDTDIRRANRGIMNGHFELYRDLTGAMKKAHSDIKKEIKIKDSR